MAEEKLKQSDVEKQESKTPRTLEEQIDIEMKKLAVEEQKLQELDAQIERLKEKREALIKKINNKTLLLKEKKYDALNEQLKNKGVSVEDVQVAIASNDMEFLMSLAIRAKNNEEIKAEELRSKSENEQQKPKTQEKESNQQQEVKDALGPKGKKVLGKTEQAKKEVQHMTQQPNGMNAFYPNNERSQENIIAPQQSKHKPQGMGIFFPEEATPEPSYRL